jgi:hypothetical protein
VALIERHLLGGDCLNTGCVPSKALLRAARAVYDIRRGQQFGVRGLDAVELDFGAVMERMRGLQAEISRHDSARRFQDQLGVDVLFGQARFVDDESIEVVAPAGFDRARSAPRPGRGAADSGLADSGFLHQRNRVRSTQLPRGWRCSRWPVGCELARPLAVSAAG